jgi:short-subunit dehydrogenase
VQQVDLNVRALIALTHAFAPLMVTARRGGVINIASTAAFQPLAGATVYAASKAFVLFFTEALSLELEGTGVTVTAACPGPVATHFFATMNPKLARSWLTSCAGLNLARGSFIPASSEIALAPGVPDCCHEA